MNKHSHEDLVSRVRHLEQSIYELGRQVSLVKEAAGVAGPPPAPRPALFRRGEFTLASGARSSWKIECDALTPEDWEGLAAIAVGLLPPFSSAAGVPRGGVPFAAALDRHSTHGSDVVLICEDVVTTGGSMSRFRYKVEEQLSADGRVGRFRFVGVCAFARGPVPDWVVPVWRMGRSG